VNDLLTFLRTHPLAWLLPIVAYLALLVGVAWLALRVPESPFAYSLY
jgi:hypothetical protein